VKIILLKDVENTGKKYEIKEVALGFAKNFLFPKNLAKPATKENLMWLNKKQKETAKKAEEELKNIQEQVSQMDGLEIIIPAKINEQGKVFGSINQALIIEKIAEQGFEIKKNQIELKEPIKEPGEWPIKISFPHGLEAEIRVIVVDEEAQEE